MLKTALQFLIRVYAKVLSPFVGNDCRFHPTCSCYAYDALELHGALKGSVMAAKRLLCCQPYYKGPMIDEVPLSIDWGTIIGYKRAIAKTSPKNEKDKNNATT